MTGFKKWVSVIAPCFYAFGTAMADPLVHTEAPFEGGVFSRAAAEYTLESHNEDAPRFSVAKPIHDKHGNTNDLIVLFDFDGREIESLTPAMRAASVAFEKERGFIQAVNRRESKLVAMLGDVQESQHLIVSSRLSQTDREMLSMSDPEERLQRYVVLRYPSVMAATAAMKLLKRNPAVLSVEQSKQFEFSWSPSDSYFAINPQSAGYYQWGMHAMNFPAAWDLARGHAYVGIVDGGGLHHYDHPDLKQNFRPHQFFVSSIINNDYYSFHGLHVAGVIGATQNNGIGVSGACGQCSLFVASTERKDEVEFSNSIYGLVTRGVSIINMSMGGLGSCAEFRFYARCDALQYASDRDVVMVASAGNRQSHTPQYTTDFPANHSSVLAVGGAMATTPSNPSYWISWVYDQYTGSRDAGWAGVIGPARSVVSTVPPAAIYIPESQFRCSDQLPVDESGRHGDGYASCTGTSMAAPHVSGLAGILRSILPLTSADDIKNMIRESGSHRFSVTEKLGYGMPNAHTAVTSALARTGSGLTPLFSLYSEGRSDYFHTTSPHMASAATWGTMLPVNSAGLFSRYRPQSGNYVDGYLQFPSAHIPNGYPERPSASAWVFTTHMNPINGKPLVPLYRMSWKCGDATPYPPAICRSKPNHIDTTYTTDQAGITAYQNAGYKLDGVEGYIYPKNISKPAGTERLMRKYNPSRDDHTIFPESMLASMIAQGYTQNSGSDWLGYVYPNNLGTRPSAN